MFVPSRGFVEEKRTLAVQFRSILFVPGDRPDRFSKAMDSQADALILDLEDSVSLSGKDKARADVSEFLSEKHPKPVLVRVNPIESGMVEGDLSAILSNSPDAIVLPKAEGAHDVIRLDALMGDQKVPVLPIATETPKAVFELATYQDVSERLCGLTWGAEDLPAAIGASTSREPDGSFTAPYEWVRSQMLFAAHAANVAAIETVYPDIKDEVGLGAYAQRGRRDGFTAMMAIHPVQCEIINRAFSPSEEELLWAQKVVDAFIADPGAGVLQLDGKMIDAPHYKQALKLIERYQTNSNRE